MILYFSPGHYAFPPKPVKEQFVARCDTTGISFTANENGVNINAPQLLAAITAEFRTLVASRNLGIILRTHYAGLGSSLLPDFLPTPPAWGKTTQFPSGRTPHCRAW
jgi:hypothetical protein